MYQNTCIICGSIFSAQQKRAKYCSQRCRQTAARKGISGQNLKNQKITDDEILESIKKGLTRKEIADKYNVHVENLAKRMQRLGVHATYARTKRANKRKRYKYTWEEYKKIKKEQAEQNAKKKKIEDQWYKATHTIQRECNICGSLFYCLDKETRCTCSTECSKEYARRKRNIHNDTRINKNNLIDRDITLEKLYIRDNGICYLCGKPCDWNDYIIRDDIKICGNNYPSQDHVIPLARGGKHQWENVRLAHWMCNIKKSDTTPTYTKEMSREHARKMAIARCTNKKKTAQYTLDGKLIKIWDSTAQIERELGLNSKHIQNICRREKSKTGNSYGYHWEYLECQ